MQLSEAIESLCTAVQADGRSSRTVYSYREKLSHLLAFLGDVPVEGITVDQLRRFLADQRGERTLYASNSAHKPRRGRLSPFTVKTRFMAVRRLFSFLEQEGHLELNPTRRIKTSNPRCKEPKGVSAEDVKALLATTEVGSMVDRRDRAIILFLCDTGCRVGGLCSLKVGDVDLEQGLAVVTEKGQKSRFVMFTSTTAEALRAWLEVRPGPGSDVFIGLRNRSDGALTPNGVATMLARRSRRAGCTGPTNAHAFRHGFARHFLLHGGDLGPLADILGHEDVSTTKSFYGIFTLKELQEMHSQHSPVAEMFEEGV